MGDTPLPDPAAIRIHSAVPTFLAADVGATARWYAQQLGFRLAGSFPADEPWAWASLMRGSAEIMLLRLGGYPKPDLAPLRPEGLWDAYLRMDGVEALFRTLRDQPFVVSPLVHRPYGDWEFEVRDPNGYRLVFGGAA
jgi:hypothetical protein